ncbi:MAG: hypothetical protein ACAF41_24375 [Leptolyngbya sp. BL-A-14]
MRDVLIVVEPASSEATAQMVSALKAAILAEQTSESELIRVDVVSSNDLNADDWTLNKTLLCPLTLHLPAAIAFPAQAIYAACRNVEGLRQQLTEWQYATGTGEFWLPIVLTAKGPLYAEVIGVKAETSSSDKGAGQAYAQPIHLTDTQRQPLYALGQRLLRSLKAPPAVYLMQFGWQADALCFDRLLPFPDAPALASLNVQTPHLFACHWLCLSGQPVTDLAIERPDV